MPCPVTALYASLLAILIVALGNRVSTLRRTSNIGIGPGDDSGALVRAVRVHANAIENVPITLILLLTLELSGLDSRISYVLGGVFVVGRLLHVAGLSRSTGYTRNRFFGMLLTWMTILVLAAANLVQLVR